MEVFSIFAIGTIKAIFTFGVIVATVISSWFLGMRMRRRMRRALGADADSELELTSLNAWMKVEDAEAKARYGTIQKFD